MSKTPISEQPAILTTSVGLIKPSIALIIKNIDTLLWLVIIPVFIGGLGSQLIANVDPTSRPQTIAELQELGRKIMASGMGQAGIGLTLLSYAWLIVTYPASLVLMVHATTGRPTDVKHCLQLGFRNFIQLYLLNFMIGVMIIGGLLFFIVPGLILLRRYFLAPYAMLSHHLTIDQTLERVTQESKPYAAYIWGTIGMLIGLGILSLFGSVVPLIGFLISTAITYCYFFGPALRYQEITSAFQQLADKK